MSATETLAEKLAVAAGVNVTEMLQLAPAASVLPQVVVSAKSDGLAPVMLMRVIVRVLVPGFDKVIACAAEVLPSVVVGNVRLVGLRTALGTCGAVPVPLSVAVCGVFAALSATEMVAEKLAAEAGVKVAEMLQVAPAARVPVQLVVYAKSVGLAPEMVMPVIVRVALPGFDSVIDCAVEVLPTVVPGKTRLVGLSTA